MKSNRKIHIYRIIDPKNSRPLDQISSKNKVSPIQQEMAEITQQLVKHNQYIYFDLEACNFQIDVENGVIKLMQKESNPESEDEEDGKKYGDSIVTNLSHLSKGSNQIANYLNTLDLSQKKKEVIRGTIKSRLQSIRRSKQNGIILSKQNQFTNFYKKDLKEYMLKRKLRQLNKELSNKEHHLIKKLGIKNDYDFPIKNIISLSPSVSRKTSTPTKSMNKTSISFSKSIGKRAKNQGKFKQNKAQQQLQKIFPTIAMKKGQTERKQQKQQDESAYIIQIGMPNFKRRIHKSFA